ncbi:nucleotidyltransferase [Heliobacterium undosum]|uniref:Nucleotidyltransferase n=1 Tax=Heliomicrobium undosum TaxID=121734 RepID=A0A845L4J5_9FIRM|nr:HI0074 family nucleotidyltransferase substrate-binding subunit [Heliomicrobium undosum]MZP29764.1 nucleotidyltransferase [Heliomicrobium undosum]
MNQKEIRWRQRFENFDKAYRQFHAANSDFDRLNLLEKEGMVQRFEYTFELAWKTLKDYLEANDVIAKFPRDVIKEAFRYELIEDGDTWMDMLESRNVLTHTYNEERFSIALKKINGEYASAISQVHQRLASYVETGH